MKKLNSLSFIFLLAAIFEMALGPLAFGQSSGAFFDHTQHMFSSDGFDSYAPLDPSQYEEKTCLKTDAEGKCTLEAPKYLLRQRRIEENLRALVYLARMIYLPSSKRNEELTYSISNKKFAMKDHAQYGQCILYGGVQSDFNPFFNGLFKYGEIDVAAENYFREQARKLTYCREIRKAGSQITEQQKLALQQQYLKKNQQGQYAIPECTITQENAIQKELQQMADTLAGADAKGLALYDLEKALEEAESKALENLAMRESQMAMDWIPAGEVFGIPYGFEQSTKAQLAFDRQIFPLWSNVYNKRAFCSPVKLGIKRSYQGDQFWQQFFRAYAESRAKVIEQSIEQTSKKLLRYLNGNLADYPRNNNYGGEGDNINNFLSYLVDRNAWVQLMDGNLKNLCKPFYQNDLTSMPNNAPDRGPNQNDYAVIGKEPLEANIRVRENIVNEMGFEQRGSYVLNRLITLTEEEVIENKRNSNTNKQIPYYSAFDLLNKLQQLKNLAGCAGEEAGVERSSCFLLQKLRPLDSMAVNPYENRFKVERVQLSKPDYDFNQAPGYQDLVRLLLPGGDFFCYSGFRNSEKNYSNQMARNPNFLNPEAKKSFQMQQEIYGLKRALIRSITDYLKLNDFQSSRYMVDLYPSGADLDKSLFNREISESTILDVNDFTLYAMNELYAVPPYKELVERYNLTTQFEQNEINNPVGYHGLLSSTLAWVQVGLFDRISDSYVADTSRANFYAMVRNMIHEGRRINQKYGEQLEKDMKKLADVENNLNGSGPANNQNRNGIGNSSGANNENSAGSGGNSLTNNLNNGFNFDGLDNGASVSSGRFNSNTNANPQFKESLSASLGMNDLTAQAARKKRSESQFLSKVQKRRSLLDDQGQQDTKKLSNEFNKVFSKRARQVSESLASSPLLSAVIRSPHRSGQESEISNASATESLSSNLNNAPKVVGGYALYGGQGTDSLGMKAKAAPTPGLEFAKLQYKKVRGPEDMTEEQEEHMMEMLENTKGDFKPEETDSLFELLTKRYFISAYPKFFKRKNNISE